MQWEKLYRTGALATAPTSPDGGIDLEVRDVWVQFVSALPDSAALLDVGTGNGIIPLVAKDTAARMGRRLDITAIDLATSDPRQLVPDGATRFDGITFRSSVAMERLPFADASFDAAAGHFALEYSNVPDTLAELHRVLRPGSDVQFIIGHAESTLARSAKTSLREADLVFNDVKVFRRLKRLVSMERVIPNTTYTVSTELREAIQTLKQAHGVAQQAGGGRVIAVALDATKRMLEIRREASPQASALQVDRAEAELRELIVRVRDLFDHVKTPKQMDDIERVASDAGFSLIERLPLHHGGADLFAWQLVMHRA